MQKEDFEILADKYLSGSLSDEERILWKAAMALPEVEQFLEERMRKDFMEDTYEVMETPERAQRLNQVLEDKIGFEEVKAVADKKEVPVLVRRWYWVAAAVLILAGGMAYWKMAATTRNDGIASIRQHTVLPGKNGAILTLADGSQIVLDSLQNGLVSTQDGVKVELREGVLAYQPGDKVQEGISYNTITIPRGFQYALVLPDGSKVWLNSASSIRFPVVFASDKRTVQITGEVYMEVAENKNVPFFVQIGDKANVQVLGTSFNIKAYPDEPVIAATLISGSIRVGAGMLPAAGSLVLQPAQQVAIDAGNGKINLLKNVDRDAVVAWKNGLFHLDNRAFDDVMRELGRWYNLEIAYENGVPDIQLGGEISRKEQLRDVLLGLKDVKIKFRIEENKRLVILQ